MLSSDYNKLQLKYAINLNYRQKDIHYYCNLSDLIRDIPISSIMLITYLTLEYSG